MPDHGGIGMASPAHDKEQADAAWTTALLRRHPAWPASASHPGFWTAPAIDERREIVIEAGQTKALEALGIRLANPPGPGNRLLLDAATPRQRLVIDLARARDCTLLLGRTARLAGEVKATGTGHLLAAAGEAPGFVLVHVTFRGEAGLVLLGAGVTSNRTNLLAEGPEGAILVGDDAMFANGVTLRTSDSHGIVDIATRAQINPPGPVLIEPHVWLGQDAIVMKGVRVGAGSIVAGRAVVTKDVVPRTLVAGVPARMLREGVTWTRQSRPRPDQMDEAIRALPEG
jgi:acetyltransferase-like isoleucine patch superfamily enzyme